MTINYLTNKRILVGVTGGIAAYKSAELVRQLKEAGAEVRVVMTKNACQFITPLTMQAVSGWRVYSGLFDDALDHGMPHIELARWCDVVLIAPASANFIACLAVGMADHLLSTVCLATTAPLVVAPAMNRQMWENSAVQENIGRLNKRSVKIVGPDSGEQACGEVGLGRMADVEALVAATQAVFAGDFLMNLKVMVTAGATREAIDPVRYISNHSSGRMGYAIASSAIEAGANVTLISGVTRLTPPANMYHIGVNTAEQMLEAVLSGVDEVDIFIAVAAVADYRRAEVAQQKLKKQADQIWLLLEKNPDILAQVTQLDNAPFTVGFAAETENLVSNAQVKFKDKQVDMMVANLVGEGLGFNTAENALEVFWQAADQTLHQQSLQRARKETLARQLVRLVAERYYEKHSDQVH